MARVFRFKSFAASGLSRKFGAHLENTAMNSSSDFHTQRAKRLTRLKLELADFEEKFSRSSGPGGQHVNKVSTAVMLRHVPSGVAVTVQDTRSQSMNRQLAWTRLLDAIEEQRRAERAARRAEIEKKRRQNSKRPRGVKERILEGKKRRAQIKKFRAKDW
jgi:protein subunit release factor B